MRKEKNLKFENLTDEELKKLVESLTKVAVEKTKKAIERSLTKFKKEKIILSRNKTLELNYIVHIRADRVIDALEVLRKK